MCFQDLALHNNRDVCLNQNVNIFRKSFIFIEDFVCETRLEKKKKGTKTHEKGIATFVIRHSVFLFRKKIIKRYIFRFALKLT